MKKLKRLLAVILCLVLIQAPVQLVTQTTEVHAATGKAKFFEKKGKYYYQDPDGTLVKNDWRTVKKTGARYYFGKDGAAYAAEKNEYATEKYYIAVKKIGGKYYGFDLQGRMVKGLWATMSGKAHYFDPKTGVYDAKKSSSIRKAVLEGKSASSARKVLDKFEKPVKIRKFDSCYKPNGQGIQVIYKHSILEVFRYNSNGKEIVTGFWPR